LRIGVAGVGLGLQDAQLPVRLCLHFRLAGLVLVFCLPIFLLFFLLCRSLGNSIVAAR